MTEATVTASLGELTGHSAELDGDQPTAAMIPQRLANQALDQANRTNSNTHTLSG
jgi:hypothetical protein